jgi:hypothetical protein
MFDRGACPSIAADLDYFRTALNNCWASTNPFRAIPGEPNARGVRHTPVESQCHMPPTTDVGLCASHHEEIIHETV